jgi:hypothetical protein
LTKLADGTSYVVAGPNITINSQSNGSIAITGSASGGGDPGASYLVLSATGSLSNERVFTAGTGLSVTDGGAGGSYAVAINDSVVATVSGTTFTGATKHNAGLSGSLTRLVDGTSYIIAGSGITVTSSSNGPITIAATGGGSGDQFFSSVVNSSIFTTGSTAFRGGESGINSPVNKGTDVFFYVSGSQGSKDTSTAGVALFGGDVVISGSLYGGSPLKIKSNTQITGTLSVTTGFSGSLTRLSNGSPYLLAGPSVSLSTGSNGAVTISAVPPGTPEGNTGQVQFNLSGSFEGNADMTFEPATKTMTVGILAIASASLNNGNTQILTRNGVSGLVSYTESLSEGVANYGIIYAFTNFNYLP